METLTARQYYDKALLITEGLGLRVAVDDPGIRKKLLSVASYLELAVVRSKEPFPDANARLSYVLLLLRQNAEAKRHAESATGVRPYAFWARLTEFGLACIRLENHNPFIDQSSFVGTVVTAGIAVTELAGKKGGVRKAAERLAWSFIETVKQDFLGGNYIDLESYVNMAEILLDVGDYLRQVGVREPSVYRVILQVPWDSTNLGEFADVVTDLWVRAEGNLHF